MALNLNKCRMHKTQEFPIVPGSIVAEEGLPLVREFVDGKEHVRVYDGTGENVSFIGFSYTESLTPHSATESVEVTLDDAGTIYIDKKLIPTQISVYKDGVRLANSDITVDNGTVTVAGSANAIVYIVYMYEPTVNDLMQNSQLRLLIPTMSSSEMTGSIGVIMDGEVYTDKVDLSADFTVPNIKFALTAGGLVTCYTGDTPPAGALPIAGGMELVEYPMMDNAALGLRIVR